MSKKNKSLKTNKKIIYLVLIVLIFFVSGGAFLAGYYVANSEKNTQVVKEDKTKKALNELQHLVDENLKKMNDEKNITKKKKELVNSEAIDYQNNETNISEKNNTNNVIIPTNKPKLVIIMDDMSFKYEVKSLKKLDLNITPSFFPPTKDHPRTALYAREFKHYMVHFPMQATNPNFHEEVNTLHTNSSYDFIKQRVETIKAEFPKARFVNNHTGSKFTSNYAAMNRFYKIISKDGIIFVDSRTTSKSKAPLLAKKYHQILFSRDIFLDNKPNIHYIRNQLKRAINIAKKRGYAIAICHPHATTFKALSQSKDLLKKVQLIYIDQLYELYKTHQLSKF